MLSFADRNRPRQLGVEGFDFVGSGWRAVGSAFGAKSRPPVQFKTAFLTAAKSQNEHFASFFGHGRDSYCK
jgi:hypothetical protein